MVSSTTTAGKDEQQAKDSSAPTAGTMARTTVYIRKPRTVAGVVGDASTDNAQSSKESDDKLDERGLKVQADWKKSEAASEKGKNDHAGGNKGADTLKEKMINESKAFKDAPDAPSFSLGLSQEDEQDQKIHKIPLQPQCLMMH